MNCPSCRAEIPAAAEVCPRCGRDLAISDDATELLPGSESNGTELTGPSEEDRSVVAGELQTGSRLGDRYEILQMLGKGGMGAVYKARDVELDRLVALKVIRPELAKDPEILKRFKQEIILSREVTHRNVIRIFDLGQADGIQFISMEFVEGRDLQAILKQEGQQLPVNKTVEIIEQVCLALEEAHEEGVVHRDLKPSNIMIDKDDRVVVMDFGIARSVQITGVTQTGSVLGTPDYMSPEQVKGEHVDSRSDVFALGVIFYQLLTGEMPYQADTPMASMYLRTQERAGSVREVNPEVPGFIGDVIARCLEISPQRRYQSARELVQDLEIWRGGTPGTMSVTLRHLRALPRRSGKKLGWVLMALVLSAIVVMSVVFFQRAGPEPGDAVGAAPEEVTSLAILPFQNSSGEASLDWLGPSLAELLRTEVGQSSQLRIVSSDRVNQILYDLRITPGANLDPATIRRLGEFSKSELLILGRYLKLGEQIRIDATLHDLENQRSVPLKADANSEQELLQVVGELAQSIQGSLGLSAEIVEELQASSFRPSTQSLLALRYYSEGLELARQGNHIEARKRFEASTKEDPEFALAHSRLALTHSALGYDDDAERASRRAVELSEDVHAQERYLILANHARIQNDYEKAIESYEKLAEIRPQDPEILFNLAANYENAGQFEEARSRLETVVEDDPNYVDALFALGRVEIRSGHPQESLEFLNRALSLTVQLGNDEGKATMLNAIGIAYKNLNRLDEALRYFEDSLEIKYRLNDKNGIAASLSGIAQIQQDLGRTDEALARYQEALAIEREIGDRGGVGFSLINLGSLYDDLADYEEALELYRESLRIQRDLGYQYEEALCLNNIGGIYLSQGQYGEAMTNFNLALQIREGMELPVEAAETLHNLGETSAKMAGYDDALEYFLRALDIYREEGDQLAAARESYSMGTVFEHQGRYGAGLEAKQEAAQVFRGLEERGFWMVEVVSGYGNALSLNGRFSEAEVELAEALELARSLQNRTLEAQALNYQGDLHYFGGDWEAAATLYARALELASETSDRHLILLSRSNAAKAAVKAGRSQEVLDDLESLAEETESLGLRYLSTSNALVLAEALLESGHHARALEELEGALGSSERLGLQGLLCASRYRMGEALRLEGREEEARQHYREALRTLDAMVSEAAAGDLLTRADLEEIDRESRRWAPAEAQ